MLYGPYRIGGGSKGAAEYVAGVSFTGGGGSHGCAPKPILARLGDPKRIRYAIKDDQILVSNADSQWAIGAA